MKKEKKGFTLIELMVVIVIIGILAAIAIPKLFGMTAKAKAQEVPGAAGTWSKLQAAYAMEMSKVGDMTQIAYKHPGGGTSPSFDNNNFTYNAPTPTVETTANWYATVRQKLNESCGNGDGWTVTFEITNNTDGATGTGASGCLDLTPQFVNLR